MSTFHPDPQPGPPPYNVDSWLAANPPPATIGGGASYLGYYVWVGGQLGVLNSLFSYGNVIAGAMMAYDAQSGNTHGPFVYNVRTDTGPGPNGPNDNAGSALSIGDPTSINVRMATAAEQNAPGQLLLFTDASVGQAWIDNYQPGFAHTVAGHVLGLIGNAFASEGSNIIGDSSAAAGFNEQALIDTQQIGGTVTAPEVATGNLSASALSSEFNVVNFFPASQGIIGKGIATAFGLGGVVSGVDTLGGAVASGVSPGVHAPGVGGIPAGGGSGGGGGAPLPHPVPTASAFHLSTWEIFAILGIIGGVAYLVLRK